VAPESTGPLSEDAIRVWLHVPNPRRAVIEVRRTDRSLARRSLRIADYPADLAARFVAIATSQMVRVQARPLVKRPPPVEKPKPPPNHDAGFRVDAGAHVQIMPMSTPLWFAGPELALEHRRGITSIILYGRWLIGEGDDQRARWLEVGGSFDVRLDFNESWRARLALKAGGVSLALPDAVTVDELPSDGAEWAVRAGGLAGIEAALTREAWLALTVEPGAALRKLDIVDAEGRATELGGFTLGVGISLVGTP
jgi:hypothetical protein